MTMQAARFLGQGRIEVRAAAEPAAAAGEVLLRVHRCALCGSELRLFRNGAGWIPGHEILGVVDQPGHALHGLRALVYIPVFCGQCASCRAGDTQLCDQVGDLIGWNRPGGYAEALAVPEQCLLPVPDDISDALAPLLLDTIGTTAHAIRLARRALSDAGPALVLGAGPIGLGAILTLQTLGFSDIEFAEPRAYRAAIAAEFGARPFDAARLRRFALVLESSGRPEARQIAIEAVRPHGVSVLLGESEQPWPFTETRTIRRKDFWMLRSFYFPIGDYAENLELLRQDRARFGRLVDATGDLGRLQDMFAAFAEGRLAKPMFSR